MPRGAFGGQRMPWGPGGYQGGPGRCQGGRVVREGQKDQEHARGPRGYKGVPGGQDSAKGPDIVSGIFNMIIVAKQNSVRPTSVFI